MNVLEKEIEDLIWHGITKDRYAMNSKGLHIHDTYHYFRQFDIGNYGRPDIVGFDFQLKPSFGDRNIKIHIIEIKKDEVNAGTFLQAIRYCHGINRYVEKSLPNCTVSFQIDLIGRTVSRCDFIYLPNLFSEVRLFKYEIDFKSGILFKEERNYCLSEESFPPITQFKDTAKQIIRQKMHNRDIKDLPF